VDHPLILYGNAHPNVFGPVQQRTVFL
jgi:hypothetical protein